MKLKLHELSNDFGYDTEGFFIKTYSLVDILAVLPVNFSFYSIDLITQVFSQ